MSAQRDELRFVTFRMAEQWFGVPVSRVQEVLLPQRVTRIPLAPSDVVGFLNLRGQIVTMLDLAARLGCVREHAWDRLKAPTAEQELLGMDVVVHDGGELFALPVDDVGDVMTVSSAALERVPDTLDTQWRDVCAGIVRRDRDVLIVLETERMVSDSAMYS
jgi:purine-binding chemotaxis protein CheW